VGEKSPRGGELLLHWTPPLGRRVRRPGGGCGLSAAGPFPFGL